MSYQLLAFNEVTGQLQVKIEDLGTTISIDVPLDSNGQYITGPELDAYIQGFIPMPYIERLQRIAQGVGNTEAIKALVPPPAPVAPVSADEMWERIKAYRDKRKVGGTKVGTKWFHNDVFSRSQWLGLKDEARDLIAAGAAPGTVMQRLGQPINWKTMDGSFVTVTVELPAQVAQETGDSDLLIFAKAEEHHARMLAAPVPGAYDYTTGWPLIYGEE